MYGPTSNLAGAVDATFYFIVAVSAFFLLLVTGLLILFSIRYRRSRHPEAVQIHGNLPLEIIWTVIPVALVLAMFYFGFEGFRAMRDAPEDAMLVKVIGRMWDWSFRYENGRESGTLYVPEDRPVKLVLTSLDVNHSFYIPAFRVKEDVVPGRENYLWFKPQSTGPADIYCAEYCGQQHAYMMSEVIVMEPAEFAAWYATPAADSTAVRSAAAILDAHACLDCHSLDGSEDIGPTFKGLYGSHRTVIIDGAEEERIAMEGYLRRAILDPNAEYVKGYEINMPAPVDLSEEELEAIIAYLREAEGS
jgi:cytochrome c oxidase subunit 2